MPSLRWTMLLGCAFGLVVLSGCGRDTVESVDANADELPDTLWLTTAPEGARSLKEVKASASDGDRVTMFAVVGGRREPIAANRAILTVIDADVETCDRIPGDSCPTPWDACCEPQDEITAASATVQVVDAEGRPLRLGLAGAGGVAPLKQLIIVGTVRGPVDQNNLVIDASGIHVRN